MAGVKEYFREVHPYLQEVKLTLGMAYKAPQSVEWPLVSRTFKKLVQTVLPFSQVERFQNVFYM